MASMMPLWLDYSALIAKPLLLARIFGPREPNDPASMFTWAMSVFVLCTFTTTVYKDCLHLQSVFQNTGWSLWQKWNAIVFALGESSNVGTCAAIAAMEDMLLYTQDIAE